MRDQKAKQKNTRKSKFFSSSSRNSSSNDTKAPKKLKEKCALLLVLPQHSTKNTRSPSSRQKNVCVVCSADEKNDQKEEIKREKKGDLF